MSNDLERQLGQLAASWEQRIEPIDLDELARPATAVVASPPRRRSWVPTLSAAAAALVLVIGLIALVDDEADSPPVDPGPTSTLEDDVVPTANPPDPAVETTVPTTTEASSATTVTLRSMLDERSKALRALPGFRATVVRSQTSGPVPSVGQGGAYEITILADGRIWAEGQTEDDYEWFSYDPVGGMYRGAARQAGGSVLHFELSGAGESITSTPTPLNLAFPELPFDGYIDPSSAVVEIEHDGRPAWQVTSRHPGDRGETVRVIDRATGLVVVNESRSVASDQSGTSERRVELLGLEVVTELPSDFPERYPDPEAVARRPQDIGPLLTSFDDAAAVYGDGFVVPSEALPDRLPSVETSEIGVSVGPFDAPIETTVSEVTISWTFGSIFAPDRVILNKVRLQDEIEAENLHPYERYADGLCFVGYDVPDGACAALLTDDVIRSGALAGAPSAENRTGPATADPVVGVTVLGPGGIIRIEAPTEERLLELMNSFVVAP